MRVLLDTNILLRLAQPASDAAAAATSAIDTLGANRAQFFIVPQVIYEYWVVCSRPVERNGLGHQPAHVNRDVNRLIKLFTLLRDERTIFETWHKLVHDYEVAGKNAHDARLVAAMKRHQLDHILTFNHGDFRRYRDVTVIDPAAI